MQKNARLVLDLRAARWDEKKINDFLLYIETGEQEKSSTNLNQTQKKMNNKY